jgi:hypothetical protein
LIEKRLYVGGKAAMIRTTWTTCDFFSFSSFLFRFSFIFATASCKIKGSDAGTLVQTSFVTMGGGCGDCDKKELVGGKERSGAGD